MLQIRNLRKEFDTVVAVDGVSLTVERGELFGLLGPNGAGKTTTIRMVLNIIKPDSGEILFDGHPFSPETWNTIGYLPEERGLYRKSKVLHTLLYFAALKGIHADEARPSAYAWLERFGLADRADAKIEELSKGNQQKVQLITAILHNPRLLILDEPFSGLDPVNQITLKDILLGLRREDVAIIFSTHQMEQVEKLCDNICLINKGKPVLQGALRQIKQQYGKNSVHVEFEGDGSFLRTLPAIKRADIYQNYAELELVEPGQSGDLLRSLAGKLEIRKFEILEPSLNSIFLSVVGPPPAPMPESEKRPVSRPANAMPTFNPRIRKPLASFILTIVIALAVFLAVPRQNDTDWTLPVILLAAVVLSGVRLARTIRTGAMPEEGGNK
jgi:ABC-2 type transport system ATP-binding protein